MEFCREHERAISLRHKQLALQQVQIEQVISFRRRKRREFEHFCSSLLSILILMAMAFVIGALFTYMLLQ